MQTECFISFEPGQDVIHETDLALEFFEICAEQGVRLDRLILGALTAIAYLSESVDSDPRNAIR
jgi:hypothetical protein